MKKHLLLIVLQLGASASDAYFTHRNQTVRGAYENNPLASALVRSTAGQIAYFSGETAVKLTLVELLRKHKHAKLADALAVAGVADNAAGAAYSAAHYHGR